MQGAEITDEEARFFLSNGYLILRGVIRNEELARLRTAMDDLMEIDPAPEDPDYIYGKGHISGEKTLRRIEYVIDKRDECKALLGHPYILGSVEKLMGPGFIPTWDSMVLKMPGQGIAVPWHRDAGTDFVGDKPIFNVDFYLDAADLSTCVWVIPGSHQWNPEKARMELDRRAGEFSTEGAIPALMQPGDVLFHDILALHGSPANTSSNLRRVLYYEFRAAHVEEALGPHIPAYIPLKQNVLLGCIERRKTEEYVDPHEVPYAYSPPAPYAISPAAGNADPPTFRYPHDEYWRT